MANRIQFRSKFRLLVFCRKEELQTIIASEWMANALDLAVITLAVMQDKLTPQVSAPPDES